MAGVGRVIIRYDDGFNVQALFDKPLELHSDCRSRLAGQHDHGTSGGDSCGQWSKRASDGRVGRRVNESRPRCDQVVGRAGASLDGSLL